jgi:hypothetical protein
VTKISNMSSSEQTNIEFKTSVYESCDPAYLRELRASAGVDLTILARTACLSVAQVRALETDHSDHLFYSEAIKRQAYKRLLMILGAEPPTVEVPEELRDAGKVADAHLNTLDQIVAMSQLPALNRSTLDWVRSGLAKLNKHKQFMGALLLLLVAVGLFALHGLQPVSDFVAVASAGSDAVQAQPKPALAVAANPAQAPAPAPAALAASVDTAIAAPVAPAPAPASEPAASVGVSKVAGCSHVTDALPQLTPFTAQKEGRYVYMVSPSNVEICVVDGNKQATVVQLKAGESRSVYGVSPWQVSSPQLSKLQIYFQGWRVAVPEAATRVSLVEVPVSR